ncbi:MAG: hypothetical protein QNJ73_00185 [Gammaproteobacteria bacterium]|nr:hypothetical protein [Gammaproteobacteria bacterium]
MKNIHSRTSRSVLLAILASLLLMTPVASFANEDSDDKAEWIQMYEAVVAEIGWDMIDKYWDKIVVWLKKKWPDVDWQKPIRPDIGPRPGVPELNASAAAAALMLSCGGALVLTGRRRRERRPI